MQRPIVDLRISLLFFAYRYIDTGVDILQRLHQSAKVLVVIHVVLEVVLGVGADDVFAEPLGG